jgi:opacity protein-like surface antigen
MRLKDRSYKAASFFVLGFILNAMSYTFAQASDLAQQRMYEDDTFEMPKRYNDWSGFYIGGQAGYLNSTIQFGDTLQNTLKTVVQGSAIGDAIINSQTLTLPERTKNGATYGGFIGYNWDFNGTLFGFELEYSSASLKVNTVNSAIQQATIIPEVTPPVQGTVGMQIAGASRVKVQNLGSFRLRGGFAIENFLPYAFLGVALGQGSNAYAAIGTNSVWIEPQDIILNDGIVLTQPGYWAAAATSGLYEGQALGRATTLVNKQIHSVFWWGYTLGLGGEINITDNLFLRAEYAFVALDSGSKSGQPLINKVTGGIGLRF